MILIDSGTDGDQLFNENKTVIHFTYLTIDYAGAKLMAYIKQELPNQRKEQG